MFQQKEIKTFPKCADYTPYNNDNFMTNLQNNNVSLNVCKVIILGDLFVGKTSILNRFCLKQFDCNYRSTIGVDFHTEEIKIRGIPYHLQIWDTAGQERFKCIAQCYYRKARVFDLSSIRTLANCKTWLRDAFDVCKDTQPYVFLVGSKKDLLASESYKNTKNIAIETAKSLNAEFWGVSSKTGENIDNLFYRAAALSFDHHLREFNENNKCFVPIGHDLISFSKNRKLEEKRKCEC